MNFDRPMPPHRVPTLTEVVVWPEPVLEPIAEPVTVETAPEQPVEPIERGLDVEATDSAELPHPTESTEIAEAANPAEAVPSLDHSEDAAEAAAPNAAPPKPTAVAAAAPLATLPTEDQLTQRVLADIQRQVELMLDYRLREALAPLLARATDGLVRDARQELASTLRDVVARAVAQELSRHRTR